MNDWIKIEKCTPHKPELRQAARKCGVSRGDAFIAFFALWTYFDTHCEDGFLPGLSLEDVDEMAGIKGFGRAMVSVGWLVADPTGIIVVNWERHNGKSAKARAQTMRRVQAHRAKKRWDPGRVTQV